MSESLDLASTIGTWVGAGIGVVALLGILGPALIWYASTRDRQKTLNAIGRHNNNYLSSGYHLGPRIWLGQRVRAPLIKNTDSLKTFDLLPSFDASRVAKAKAIDTEATWVRFGALLEAYSIPFERGDNLLIQGTRAFLIVHPWWIFTIGLLGRYSDRRVHGNLSTRKVSIRHHKHQRAGPSPSPMTRPRYDSRTRYDSVTDPRRMLYPERSRSEVEIAPSFDETILYGITGSLAFSRVVPTPGQPLLETVKFEPNTTDESFVDTLDPKDLFLVALGFLKTSQSHYVRMVQLDETPTDIVGDENFGSVYSSDGENPDRFATPLAAHSRYSQRYSDSESDNSQRRVITTRFKSRDRPRADPGGDRVYRLGNVELDQDTRKLGRAFIGTGRIDTFCFLMMSGERASSVIKEFTDRTIVPATSKWVRISHQDNWIYFERNAAQKLAYGLLRLPWHSQRYLVDLGGRVGIGMQVFGAAANDLRKFVFRLREGLEWLSLSQVDKQRLSSALGVVDTRLETGRRPRQFTAAYELDIVLGELGSRGDQVYIGHIVGILAITNMEFRDLVYDSLRSLKETALATINLDMPSATLKVPKAFGVMQHFYVDWQEMFPDERRNHETLSSVSYTLIVLSTVQSLAKCEMLRCCPDARPLIDTVLSLGDVVHMT